MDKFFTWENLKSFVGVSSATYLLTQVIKDWIPIPTQIVSYLVATSILVCVDVFKTKDYKNIPLSLINGFVASSLASNSVALVNRLS
jgi:hypothetical protein